MPGSCISHQALTPSIRLSCDKMVINEGPKQKLVELNENMDNWGTLREITIDETETFMVKFFKLHP